MYNFGSVLNRRDSGSLKWNEMDRYTPNLPQEVVPFSYADMEFNNPPEMMEGLKTWLDTAVLGYAEITDSYYDAVIQFMARKHQWKIEKEWLVLSPGIVPALYDIVKAFTEPGDSVMLMSPVYYPFTRSIIASKRKLVSTSLINTEGYYTIDFEDMERKIKESEVKVFLLCSPHNPVGRVWTKEELSRMGEICVQNGVLIVSDEIHFDFICDGYKHTVFSTISDVFAEDSIICTAPSKSFNLGGVQVSNIIIKNKEIRDRYADYCYDNNGQWTLNIFAFKIGELAYTKCDAWFDELHKTLEENKKIVEEYIRKELPMIKVTPLEGTYLMWLDCRKFNMSSQELDEFFKKKAMIFTDGGDMFGEEGNGFERLNIACAKQSLYAALERLRKAVEKL